MTKAWLTPGLFHSVTTRDASEQQNLRNTKPSVADTPPMRRLMAFLVVLIACIPTVRASAQQRWAILTVAPTPSDVERGQVAAQHAHAALVAQGQSVLSPERSRGLLDSEVSAPMQAVPAGLADRIALANRTTTQDLSRGQNDAAVRAIEPLLRQSRPYLAAMGRDANASRNLGLLCLNLVRARQSLRDAEGALAAVHTCLELVPGLSEGTQQHPPEVIELLDRERDALGSSQTSISISAAATDPESCVIRAQGREVGHSPIARLHVIPGSYALQIECTERPSRVHVVTARAGETAAIEIDGMLDSSLTTTGWPALVRASEDATQLERVLSLVARVLQVDRIMVVNVALDATVTLRAFEMREAVPTLLGSAPLEDPVDASSRTAVENLMQGRSVERHSSAPVVIVQRGSDTGLNVLGGTLLVVGAVGYGVGWYFYTDLESRGVAIGRTTTPMQIPPSLRAYDDARLPFILSGAAAGLVASIGIPLILPDDGALLWSIVGGVAFAGLAGAGAYFMATDGACFQSAITDPCVRRSENVLLGAFLMEHSAPFLMMQLTYLVRALTQSSEAPSVSVHLSLSGGSVDLYGSF